MVTPVEKDDTITVNTTVESGKIGVSGTGKVIINIAILDTHKVVIAEANVEVDIPTENRQ